MGKSPKPSGGGTPHRVVSMKSKISSSSRDAPPTKRMKYGTPIKKPSIATLPEEDLDREDVDHNLPQCAAATSVGMTRRSTSVAPPPGPKKRKRSATPFEGDCLDSSDEETAQVAETEVAASSSSSAGALSVVRRAATASAGASAPSTNVIMHAEEGQVSRFSTMGGIAFPVNNPHLEHAWHCLNEAGKRLHGNDAYLHEMRHICETPYYSSQRKNGKVSRVQKECYHCGSAHRTEYYCLLCSLYLFPKVVWVCTRCRKNHAKTMPVAAVGVKPLTDDDSDSC
jgi:hypothetical protein